MSPAEKRGIWIHPGVKSGEPCLAGTRVPVEMVIENVWWHGVDNAMDLWCLTRPQILDACWYAGSGGVVRLHGRRGQYVAHRGPWRKRWGAWAAEVHGRLWSGRDDRVTDPPTSDGAP